VSDSAREDFRGRVAAALQTIVALGHAKYDPKGREGGTEVQRRSLVDWCQLWARPGQWQRVRSYRLWTRKNVVGGGQRLEIALRVELFGQVNRQDLAALGQNKFGRLAALYGVGLDVKNAKVQGERAVILTAEFIEELLAQPPADEGDKP
jgi:hypothetical protein